jgi:hypothetical protein
MINSTHHCDPLPEVTPFSEQDVRPRAQEVPCLCLDEAGSCSLANRTRRSRSLSTGAVPCRAFCVASTPSCSLASMLVNGAHHPRNLVLDQAAEETTSKDKVDVGMVVCLICCSLRLPTPLGCARQQHHDDRGTREDLGGSLCAADLTQLYSNIRAWYGCPSQGHGCASCTALRSRGTHRSWHR